MEKKNYRFVLEERLIAFSVDIIKVVKQLPEDRIGNHLGSQLLRSGTSPSLNYGEALGAESKRDFIHKISILLKELRETFNCLTILTRAQYVPAEHPIVNECHELISIFVKTIETTKRNMLR